MPSLRGWFVDEAGTHTFDLQDDSQLEAFESACRTWTGNDQACSVRRVVLPCIAAANDPRLHLDTTGIPRWPWRESAALCQEAFLVIVDGDTPRAWPLPYYPPDHDAHMATRLEPGTPNGRLQLYFPTVFVPTDRTSTHLIMKVYLDPWGRGPVRHAVGGSSISGRPVRYDAAGRRPVRTQVAGRALAWAYLAADEDIAVEAFRRHIDELRTVDAPPQLIARAVRAMADEERHRKLCLRRASTLAGQPVRLGPLPDLPAARTDLLSILCGVASEGCLNETISLGILLAVASRADREIERPVLLRIARDEARHAALAWDTLEWGLPLLSSADQRRVRKALHAPLVVPEHVGLGMISATDAQEIADECRTAVRALSTSLRDLPQTVHHRGHGVQGTGAQAHGALR